MDGCNTTALGMQLRLIGTMNKTISWYKTSGRQQDIACYVYCVEREVIIYNF